MQAILEYQPDNWELFTLCFLGIVLLIHWYFYFRYFRKLHSTDKLDKCEEGVSIILCVKNEIENLKLHLDSIIKQDYSNFELIIVNDGSWDGTKSYLDELSKLENIEVIHLDKDKNHFIGKKFAITMGVKKAKNDILLFTDADCKPLSNKWVSEMASRFTPGKEIVLGFSPYKRHFGLLNAFIQYETLFVGMQYIGFALKNEPYMGVGRNLAYRKSLFFKNKGFGEQLNIISGDDDLLVQSMVTKNNTAVCISKESFVESLPNRNISKWWNQKKRHLRVGKYYKRHVKWSLGLLMSSLVLFFITLLGLLLLGLPWQVCYVIYGIRTIPLWVIKGRNFSALGNVKFAVLYPFLELVYLGYYLIIGPSSLISKSNKW